MQSAVGHRIVSRLLWRDRSHPGPHRRCGSTPPVVDRLTIQAVVDTNHDIFISGAPAAGRRGRAGALPRRVQRQDAGKPVGAVAAPGFHQGHRNPPLPAGFRLHPGCARQQPEAAEDRSGDARCADPQPRPSRPPWRPDRVPAGQPSLDARGPAACMSAARMRSATACSSSPMERSPPMACWTGMT